MFRHLSRWQLAGIGLAGLVLLFAILRMSQQAPASLPVAPVALPPSDSGRIHFPPNAPGWIALPGGHREPVQSMLDISKPMKFGDYVWDDSTAPAGPLWIRIDLARQIISVVRGGHEIGSAVIIYGARDKPTPAGRFTVIQMAQDYYSRSYDAPMPYMLRLTEDGVAIHASHVRPGAATHGCIGVPMAFARLLFAQARMGDAVYVEGVAPAA